MLAWFGLAAKWQRRSFWTAENLMSSVFYGDGAIRSGFSGRTLSGLALYLLIYSTLGALVALAISDRLPRPRTLLISILFALTWYYVSFQLLWKTAMPLVALLHSAQPTVLGHLVYGTFLGRYPVYLARDAGTALEPAVETQPSSRIDYTESSAGPPEPPGTEPGPEVAP
jgi:hypothetical protein